MPDETNGLRVAVVAGTLARGGAEKQLVYMVEALHRAGHQVRVYCLTRGEYYERTLLQLGVEPIWFGRYRNPVARSLALAGALREFTPHFVHSSHFYTNLYVAIAARLSGSIGVGTARSDVVHEVEANGRWGKWLLRVPVALLVNSHAARRNALRMGVAPDVVDVLANVIDLHAFDQLAAIVPSAARGTDEPRVIAVGSLVHAKRFDRFLQALALARSRGAGVTGVVVGDGAERGTLETLASELGLVPPAVSFLGARDDVPNLLRDANIYMLTSEHEGFPNVLLEAMAAELPVITTIAGDAGIVVDDGVTGYVVADGDVEILSRHLQELASAPEMRRRLGESGRRRVESEYTTTAFAERVVKSYRSIAERLGDRRALAALSSQVGSAGGSRAA